MKHLDIKKALADHNITQVQLGEKFECRFFAPAFRNRFFSLFPANHRKSCTAPKLQKYPQKNRPTIITAGTVASTIHTEYLIRSHETVP